MHAKTSEIAYIVLHNYIAVLCYLHEHWHYIMLELHWFELLLRIYCRPTTDMQQIKPVECEHKKCGVRWWINKDRAGAVLRGREP